MPFDQTTGRKQAWGSFLSVLWFMGPTIAHKPKVVAVGNPRMETAEATELLSHYSPAADFEQQYRLCIS